MSTLCVWKNASGKKALEKIIPRKVTLWKYVPKKNCLRKNAPRKIVLLDFCFCLLFFIYAFIMSRTHFRVYPHSIFA